MTGDENARDAEARAEARRHACRRDAQECLDEIRNTAINPATRALFYSMAVEWLRLASEASVRRR